MALLACRFRLIAFQSFGFTCYTSYERQSYQLQDKTGKRRRNLPFLLLDCLGFTIPEGFFAEPTDFGVVVALRFG